MRELALFSGAGGGILGGKLLGWRTVCAVELDPYCQRVLLARQRDGILEPFPIWDDVRTFDGKPWCGHIDIVTGGFPCQDISVAGTGAGINGDRSGLWREMARIIGEVRPRFALVENSPALVARGLGAVLGDLADLGMDARWGVFSAAETGAPHLRRRIWIAADTEGFPLLQLPKAPLPTHAERFGQSGQGERVSPEHSEKDPYREANGIINALRQGALPYVCGGHDGLAGGVDRIRALGNGQVPHCMALAWKTLTGGIK